MQQKSQINQENTPERDLGEIHLDIYELFSIIMSKYGNIHAKVKGEKLSKEEYIKFSFKAEVFILKMLKGVVSQDEVLNILKKFKEFSYDQFHLQNQNEGKQEDKASLREYGVKVNKQTQKNYQIGIELRGVDMTMKGKRELYIKSNIEGFKFLGRIKAESVDILDIVHDRVFYRKKYLDVQKSQIYYYDLQRKRGTQVMYLNNNNFDEVVQLLVFQDIKDVNVLIYLTKKNKLYIYLKENERELNENEKLNIRLLYENVSSVKKCGLNNIAFVSKNKVIVARQLDKLVEEFRSSGEDQKERSKRKGGYLLKKEKKNGGTTENTEITENGQIAVAQEPEEETDDYLSKYVKVVNIGNIYLKGCNCLLDYQISKDYAFINGYKFYFKKGEELLTKLGKKNYKQPRRLINLFYQQVVRIYNLNTGKLVNLQEIAEERTPIYEISFSDEKEADGVKYYYPEELVVQYEEMSEEGKMGYSIKGSELKVLKREEDLKEKEKPNLKNFKDGNENYFNEKRLNNEGDYAKISAVSERNILAFNHNSKQELRLFTISAEDDKIENQKTEKSKRRLKDMSLSHYEYKGNYRMLLTTVDTKNILQIEKKDQELKTLGGHNDNEVNSHILKNCGLFYEIPQVKNPKIIRPNSFAVIEETDDGYIDMILKTAEFVTFGSE